VIDGDRASVTCSPVPPPGGSELPPWAMTLERNDRLWAIRSVQSP
jgi:hypothetical protein